MNLSWHPLITFVLQPQVIVAPWLIALEELGPATYLKLKATGKWTPTAGLADCDPDGLTGQSFPDDQMIVTDCPVGALIGRIGGSSASLKALTPIADAGEGKPFAVGRFALVKLPDKAVGPLYLGFNILLRPLELKALEVEIVGGS